MAKGAKSNRLLSVSNAQERMKTIFLPLLVLMSAATVTVERQTPAADDVGTPLLVLRSGKWGFIDRSGRMIVKPQFDEAGRFSEGLATVRSGDQWGYIDIAGRSVIPLRFTLAREFSGGLASLQAAGDDPAV